MRSINPPWSAKDELSLLSSALEIAKEPVESYDPRVNLFNRIGKNLESSFSNRDVLDKVKDLRRRYEENCREIREGNDADVMSSAAFEISRKIWGDGGAIKSLQPGAHQLTSVKRVKVSNSCGPCAHQVQGSKSSESGDHQHTLKKKMEVSDDFQLCGHQLKSRQNWVKDSKCFQLGAHRLALKHKRAIVFRNFQYGSSQPPLLPLPPIWRSKEMVVSSDFQLSGHQLKSKQNRVEDFKCFQTGAHQLASKQKRAVVFRNFQYGSSQPPLLALPPIRRSKVFHNFQPGSSQPPLLPLPTSWQPHNSIVLRPPERSCLPP